jgi:uncharacterized membrane protein YgcG
MRSFPKLRRTVQKPKVVSSPILTRKTPPRPSQEVYAPKEEDNGFTFPVETVGIIADVVGSMLSGSDDTPDITSDSFDSGGGDFGGAGGGSDW